VLLALKWFDVSDTPSQCLVYISLRARKSGCLLMPGATALRRGDYPGAPDLPRKALERPIHLANVPLELPPDQTNRPWRPGVVRPVLMTARTLCSSRPARCAGADGRIQHFLHSARLAMCMAGDHSFEDWPRFHVVI